MAGSGSSPIGLKKEQDNQELEAEISQDMQKMKTKNCYTWLTLQDQKPKAVNKEYRQNW